MLSIEPDTQKSGLNFAEALPDALQKAYNADERYRKGLPLDFMSAFGVLQQEDGSRKNVRILIVWGRRYLRPHCGRPYAI